MFGDETFQIALYRLLNVVASELSLPGPAALNFEHQRPAQEGTDQHQSGKEAKTCERKLDRNGLNNIGGNEEFEPEQQ